MGREARKSHGDEARRGREDVARRGGDAKARAGADKGADVASDKGAARAASRTSAEINRHAGAFVVAVLLVIASVVALLAPGWGIPLGTLLGGGNRVTLTASATDGSTASADDVATAASSLNARAAALYEKGVSATK